MRLLLVRHAWAGSSDDWEGDDAARPLDARGRDQAERLVEELAAYEVRRIVSSPTERCRATVEPLARARGVAVEERAELVEDAPPEGVLALARELGDGAVLCTHGELIEKLLGEETEKGSTTVLELGATGLDRVDRLPPPA